MTSSSLAGTPGRGSVVLQDAQGATDRGVRITKDVPVLRIDHASIKGVLLGMWQISYSGECDPHPREIERKLSPQSARLDRSKIRNMKDEGDGIC